MANPEKGADFANFIVIMIMLILALLLPIYVGLVGTYIVNYGFDFNKVKFLVTHPTFLYKIVFGLSKWAINQPQIVQLKVFGPPAAGTFFGLLFVYLIRAPLMDFRPVTAKESIHGNARWATWGFTRANW